MNNEINVRRPRGAGFAREFTTSETMTRERSHDFCQTRPLTRGVVFSICTSALTPEDAKLVFCVIHYG